MAMANFQGVKCRFDHSENTGSGEKMWVHDSDSERDMVHENAHHVMLMFSKRACPKVSLRQL